MHTEQRFAHFASVTPWLLLAIPRDLGWIWGLVGANVRHTVTALCALTLCAPSRVFSTKGPQKAHAIMLRHHGPSCINASLQCTR